MSHAMSGIGSGEALAKGIMNSSFVGTLSIAAALVGTLAQPDTASADPSSSTPEPVAREAQAAVDPLDVEPRAGEHELRTGAMTKVCDLRCQVLAFTEDTIPGLGASQLLYTVLYPGKVGLSIPKGNGTTAVTFTVIPTQIARGKGLVAKGTF
jgi:hypothetical protein